jgi:peroxiredoxin
MRHLVRAFAIAAAVMALVGPGSAFAQGPAIGAPAPAFSGTDHDGKAIDLSDYRGQFVVLEWHNNGCPYVKKHYDAGNMQKLQQEWTGRNVAWLTIISSAPGLQGYVTPEQSRAYMAEKKGAQTAVVLDPSGTIARAYNAKVSPQMVIIDPKGTLIYDGAIDDKPTSRRTDIEGAENYVVKALEEAMAGKPVTNPTNRPYGCTIKYAEETQD